jgi:hypothetical protein
MKSYTTVQSELAKKAKFFGGSWNAENVGKTVWITAILSASGVDVWTPSPLSSNSIEDTAVSESDSKEIVHVYAKSTREEEVCVPRKKRRRDISHN